MRYYEFSEILSAVLAAIAYGSVYGSISVALPLVIGVVYTLFDLPRLLVTCSASLTLKECREIPRRRMLYRGALLHVEDFITVLIFGIGLLVINYAYCDGAFRLFVLALSVGSAAFTRKSVAEAIRRTFIAVFCAAYGLTLKVLLVVLIPFKRTASFIYARLVLPICRRVASRMSVKKALRLERKKINAAVKLYRW